MSAATATSGTARHRRRATATPLRRDRRPTKSAGVAAAFLIATTLVVAGPWEPTSDSVAAAPPVVTLTMLDVNGNGVTNNPARLTEWKGELYFRNAPCDDMYKVTSGLQLVLAADTSTATSGNCGSLTGSVDDSFTGTNQLLFFAAQNNPFAIGSTARELYATEGTADTARLVRDIWPGGNTVQSSDPNQLAAVLGGTVVAFSATEPNAGREPWISDGTLEGTRLLANIAPTTSGSGPSQFTPVDGSSFVFAANDQTTGVELYRSNGNDAVRLVDINPTGSAAIQNMTAFPSRSLALFAANDGVTGSELWVTDGTAAGTRMLADINPGVASATPAAFVEVGDRMFFTAIDPVHGRGLWVTDGTVDGTSFVHEVVPPPGNLPATATNFASWNGKLFFAAPGPRIWSSDGTAEGTGPTDLVDPDELSGGIRELTVVGSMMYFASGSTSLWVTDGTPGGTTMVNEQPLSARLLVAFGNRLGFIGRVPGGFDELWVASAGDGTGPVAHISQWPDVQWEQGAIVVNADDTATGGSAIASIEYRIDDGPWFALEPIDDAFDSPIENGMSVGVPFIEPGGYELCARATDSAGNVGDEVCVAVDVDPAPEMPLALTITSVRFLDPAMAEGRTVWPTAYLNELEIDLEDEAWDEPIENGEFEPFWVLGGEVLRRSQNLVTFGLMSGGPGGDVEALGVNPSLIVRPDDGRWQGVGVDWPTSCAVGAGDLAVEVCFDVSVWSETGDWDGDGLLDGWEVNGLDADGDGVIDLPLPEWGAEVDHKDIFVEYDWRADSVATRDRTPSAAGLQTVVDMFAAAPIDAGGIPNPSGLPGINLWIDAPGASPMGGGTAIGFTPNCFMDSEFYRAKRDNFDLLRRWVFHYAIKSVSSGTDCGGGWGEVGGNDFIVYNRDAEQTFAHELGHNLKLGHGGDDRDANRKPNYVSIMNYSYSFDLWRTRDDGRTRELVIDFSRPSRRDGARPALLADLDENNLDETVVLGPGYQHFIRFVDGRCRLVEAPLWERIDWNGDGDTDDMEVSNPWLDVNPADRTQGPGPGWTCPDDQPFGVHTSFDDWADVRLDFREFGDSASGPINPPDPDGEPFPTDEEVAELREELGLTDLAVSLGGVGSATAGGTVQLDVTVENSGPNIADVPEVTLGLPAGLSYAGGVPSCAASAVAAVVCTRRPLYARQVDSFTVPLTAAVGAAGSRTITAVLESVGGSEIDDADNTASHTIEITAPATPPTTPPTSPPPTPPVTPPTTPTTPTTPAVTPAVLEPVDPGRIVDTRPNGDTVDGRYQRIGPIAARSTLNFDVLNRSGVPGDAESVVLNVTAVLPDGPGHLTVFPCGETVPNASNLNYLAGQVVPNLVVAKVGVDGQVCVNSHVRSHLIVDVVGYGPADGTLTTLTPARLLDTRPSGETADTQFARQGSRPARSTLELRVAGRGGVPADAAAVVLNVTAVLPDGSGHITVFPCGGAVPNASNLNYRTGQVVANAVLVQIGSGGNVCINTHARAHVVVDVNAYVPVGGTPSTIIPARLLDTRPSGETTDGQAARHGARPARSTVELTVTGRGGVPADAIAVWLNVTAVVPSGPGHVTVYPCGAAIPNASNINYVAGDVVPNAVLAKVGANGRICITTHTTTHLIADVNGYVTPP